MSVANPILQKTRYTSWYTICLGGHEMHFDVDATVYAAHVSQIKTIDDLKYVTKDTAPDLCSRMVIEVEYILRTGGLRWDVVTDTEATPGDGIDFESISQQMNKESPMNISTEIQDIRQIVQARASVRVFRNTACVAIKQLQMNPTR